MGAQNALEFSIKVETNEGKSNIERLVVSFNALVEEIKKPLGQIDAFGVLKKSLVENEQSLEAAQARVKELAGEIRSAEAPLKALGTDFDKAKEEASSLKTALDGQRSAFQEAKTRVLELATAIKNAKEPSEALGADFKKASDDALAFKRGIEESEAALRAAKDRVKELSGEIRTGEAALKTLGTDFRTAKDGAGALKDAVSGQRVELQGLKNAMSSAGVDVTRLASEHGRLKGSLEDVTKAFREEAAVAKARDNLGLRPHQELRAEIERLKGSYATLASSGKLSTAELAQAQLKLNDRVGELKEGMNGWISSIEKSKGAIAGVIAASAGLVSVVKTSMELETAMSDVAKVVDAPAEKIEGLKGKLLELSRTIPLTAVQLARIAEAGGQLGIASNDIEAFVTITAKIAPAFKMSADEAGEAIGKMINLYHLNVGEVEKVADAINALANRTGVLEKDILNVMTRVAGSTEIFGLARNEVVALSGAMLRLGQTPDIAATAISAMLSKLQSAGAASEEFKAALAAIGVNARQLATDINEHPQAALLKFLETLKQLPKQQLAETLVTVFGQEYEKQLAVLVTGLDKYKRALAIAGDEEKNAGGLSEEFKRQLETLQNQLTLAGNGLTELKETLGTSVMPVVKAGVETFTDLLHAVTDLARVSPEMTGFALSLGTLGASFGTLRLGAIAVRLLFGQTIPIIKDFGSAVLGAVKETGPLVSTMKDGAPKIDLFKASLVGLGSAIIVAFAFEKLYELLKLVKEYLDLQDDIKKLRDGYMNAAEGFKAYRDVKIYTLEELKKLEAKELQDEYDRLQKSLTYWKNYRAGLEQQANMRTGFGLFTPDAATTAQKQLGDADKSLQEVKQAISTLELVAKAAGISLQNLGNDGSAAAKKLQELSASQSAILQISESAKALSESLSQTFNFQRQEQKDSLDAQLDDLKTNLSTKLAALTASGASEEEISSRGLSLQRKYGSESTALQKKAMEKSIADAEAEGAAKKVIAEGSYRDKMSILSRTVSEAGKGAETIKKEGIAAEKERKAQLLQIDLETLANKKTVLEGMLSVTRSNISQMASQYQELATKIKSLDKEIQNLSTEKSTGVHEIKQSTMTAAEKYYDNWKLYDELMRKGNAASYDGMSSDAEDFYKEAAAVARKQTGAIKDANGEIVVDEQSSAAKAESAYTAAMNARISLKEKEKEKTTEVFNSTKYQLDYQQQLQSNIIGQISELNSMEIKVQADYAKWTLEYLHGALGAIEVRIGVINHATLDPKSEGFQWTLKYIHGTLANIISQIKTINETKIDPGSGSGSGSSGSGSSLPSHHTGGWAGEFHGGGSTNRTGLLGSLLALKPGEVIAKLLRTEFVLSPEATSAWRPWLERMNNLSLRPEDFLGYRMPRLAFDSGLSEIVTRHEGGGFSDPSETFELRLRAGEADMPMTVVGSPRTGRAMLKELEEELKRRRSTRGK